MGRRTSTSAQPSTLTTCGVWSARMSERNTPANPKPQLSIAPHTKSTKSWLKVDARPASHRQSPILQQTSRRENQGCRRRLRPHRLIAHRFSFDSLSKKVYFVNSDKVLTSEVFKVNT